MEESKRTVRQLWKVMRTVLPGGNGDSTRNIKNIVVVPPEKPIPEDEKLRDVKRIIIIIFVSSFVTLAGAAADNAGNESNSTIISTIDMNQTFNSTSAYVSVSSADSYNENPLYRYFPELDPKNATMSGSPGLQSGFASAALLQGDAPQSAITWQKTYGGSNDDDFNGIIRRTSDGGYIATVTTLSTDGQVTGYHGGSDIWLVKLDGSGIISWQKARGGSGYEMARDIWPTTDGGYIIAGITTSPDSGDVSGIHTLPGHDPQHDIWIAKHNNAGNVVWQRCIGGPEMDRPTSIRQTPDGGYILAGYSNSQTNPSDRAIIRGQYDAWIIKLSSTGGFQWQQTFGGLSDDHATGVSLTSDEGYIVSGYTASNDTYITDNHGGVDAWVIKLFPSGTLEWQKCYGGSGFDVANRVQQTPDGGYIVAGITASNDKDVSVNLGSDDAWILKLDQSGAIQWERTFGGSGPDAADDILLVPGGGYVVAAETQSSDIPIGGYHGSTDNLIAKFSDTGALVWELCLGGSSAEYPGSIITSQDDDYMLGGISSSNDFDVSGNHGLYDLWIVKHGEGILVNPSSLVVDARDVTSSALIPGANISLWDFKRGAWQNVTSVNGSVVFSSADSFSRYPLEPGTTYRLAAAADGFSPAIRNLTFISDGQRETVDMTKLPEVFTYSLTNVMDPPNVISGSGFTTNQNVQQWLGDKAGWKLIYNKSWANVTKADFGSEGGGLNDATFHWHVGHGAKNKTTGDTFLGLRDFEDSYVSTSDVEKKWGGKNKWVVLVSCEVLSDEKWGKALSTSHGIFGFNTSGVNDTQLPSEFFHYAMEENKTLYDSWHRATKNVFGKTHVCTEYNWINDTPVADYINGTKISISAGVRFKTSKQLYNDHLPGYGVVEPDGDPDSNESIPLFWDCSEVV